MSPSNQVTIFEAEQGFNIEVEDAIETMLEKSEALSEHNRTEKAGCIVTSSNNGRSWFH